jgi:hypothetical protein
MNANQDDPSLTWTTPTEISPVVVTGTLLFSCCGVNQRVTIKDDSFVQCARCHTLYGVALLVSLQAPEQAKFLRGVRVQVTEPVEVLAGSTRVTLRPGMSYRATQDTHGVLNVPPGFQPVLVSVPGERGERTLVALVPDHFLVESSEILS